MRMYDLIIKKRDGGELTTQEINEMIQAYCKDEVPDYQMSAFLMAVYYKGMTDRELADFTMAMTNSGDIVDLSGIEGYTVDKHSTGGVGDKTTFIIASIVASCGGKVAKMSGRGLGHTGGTIDKMESIPGMRVELSEDEFIDIVNKIGCAVIGQSNELALADKKIYALRDVTATVDSIELIASSIMSKKLALGNKGLVLDVKVGSGAFMKNEEDAIKLAKKMVAIGNEHGKNTIALITNMDQPLGREIGNANEIREVIDVLYNKGPEDLREEVIELSANMLSLVNKDSYENNKALAKKSLADGSALAKFKDMVKLQGGLVDVIENPKLLAKGKYKVDIKADRDGYIYEIDATGCGIAAVELGAGRAKKDDKIDFGAGIHINKKLGDRVAKGEVLATLYTDREDTLKSAVAIYRKSIIIADEMPKVKPCVIAKVTKDGVEKYDKNNTLKNESYLSDEVIAKMINMAKMARKNAYSPYSNFAVGAAVLVDDEKIILGANIENASYSLTNCAERVAIAKAISAGYDKIKAVAIVADVDEVCTPCGACRQVMQEFGVEFVIMANIKDNYEVKSLDELLPCGFKL